MLAAFGFVFSPVLEIYAADKTAAWQPLLNGSDLRGWETWLDKPVNDVVVPGEKQNEKGEYTQPLGLNRDPLKVFSMITQDGQPVLQVTGQIMGTLATTVPYKNYHVRLQFKWGVKKWAPRLDRPRDSGLCYHVHGPSAADRGPFPHCQELQIEEHDCGDLWALGARAAVHARPKQGAQDAFYDPTQPSLVVGEQTSNEGRCIKGADYEHAIGEWNTIELICFGEQSIHVVNGHVVCRLDHLQKREGQAWIPLSEGRIALQSEGAELFYRAMEILQIEEIPAEFEP